MNSTMKYGRDYTLQERLANQEFTRKRYRKKMDILMNEEDEQDEAHLQARQVKRRFFPEGEAELTQLMKKLNLLRGGAQGEREQDKAVIQKYTTKRKLTNVQQDEEIKRRKTMEHIGKNIKAYAPMDVASLPIDIVFFILDKMLEAIDHARFAVVCKEWQSLAEHYNRERQP
ncbi:hypothetical protein ACLB2K_002983 [Fragaria x ananassa]